MSTQPCDLSNFSYFKDIDGSTLVNDFESATQILNVVNSDEEEQVRCWGDEINGISNSKDMFVGISDRESFFDYYFGTPLMSHYYSILLYI
jgi:hypothetical protein